MDHFGFIHEKMDIKILILFVLNLLPAPVDSLTLSELVFCDDGIGYFDYSDCLAELVEYHKVRPHTRFIRSVTGVLQLL